MNPKSKMINGVLHFKNFYVIKEEDRFYSVRIKGNMEIIASSDTFKKAAKKAKLLQIGYDMGYNQGGKDEKESSKQCPRCNEIFY